MSEVKAKNTASGEDKNSPRLLATHTCTLSYSLANTLLLLAHTFWRTKPCPCQPRHICTPAVHSKWESIRSDDMCVKETEEGWNKMLYKLNSRKRCKVNLSSGEMDAVFQWSEKNRQAYLLLGRQKALTSGRLFIQCRVELSTSCAKVDFSSIQN